MNGFRSLLAVVSMGFEPLGPVMGATVVQIIRPTGCGGGAGMIASEPAVFPTYEQALGDAWWSAIDRLEADAVRLGAHGVVGVAFTEELVGADFSLKLQLAGTAVRVAGAAPLRRPFLSMLTMDETLKLVVRGWVPSGIAVGVSAVHVHAWSASPFMQGSAFSNVEMAAPTAGLQLARARAEGEVRNALRASRAEGLVAAQMELMRTGSACTGGGGGGILIEGRMLGTGVVRYRGPVAPVTGIRDLAAAKP